MRLTWDSIEATIDEGLSKGVLYLPSIPGIPWNGLISVDETSENTIDQGRYFEGRRHCLPQATEDFNISLTAYTYPSEFLPYSGYDEEYTGQPLQRFGLSYQTGDDKTGRIHLVYNAVAIPTDLEWLSISDKVDPTLFKWVLKTKPISFTGIKSTPHFFIDLSVVPESLISELKDILYGTDSTPARLPSLLEIYNILQEGTLFTVIDNGDGTWTMIGPDEFVEYLDPDTFEITWGLIDVIDANTYEIPVS